MRRRSAGIVVGALLAATACTSSDTSTPARPAGPASIHIDGMQPSGGPRAARGDACVEVGRDAAQTIGVEVTAGNWTFRPPGACGATPQCGTISLTVDPDATAPLVVQSATDFVSTRMTQLPSPLGTHVFRVALTSDDGSTFVDAATKQPLEDQVSIEVTAPGRCGGKPLDGGADASDAASDANDAGDAASDAGDAASDAGDAASDAGDAAPDAGDAASDAGDAASDAGDAASDAGDAASDSPAD